MDARSPDPRRWTRKCLTSSLTSMDIPASVGNGADDGTRICARIRTRDPRDAVSAAADPLAVPVGELAHRVEQVAHGGSSATVCRANSCAPSSTSGAYIA